MDDNTKVADLAHLSDDDLTQMGWHTLSVKRLSKLCKPLACWVEIDEAIKPEEVLACIERGEEALVETPLWTSITFGKTNITAEENRRRHIQKIAWFVKNKANEPISVDVGCEALGVWADHIISDGNHRLAAAIIRGDKTIDACVGGGVTDAKRMRLWNPNVYEVELCRRQEEAWKRQQAKPKRASSKMG
jgi:hypothetical protein